MLAGVAGRGRLESLDNKGLAAYLIARLGAAREKSEERAVEKDAEPNPLFGHIGRGASDRS